MRILITGATGMVGKNLVENASIAKHELLTPTRNELNLLSYDSTAAYIERTTPDMIIHCAGKVGGIQANISQPVAFLVENLDMGRNLVMAAKASGVRQLMNIGSSCMYPRNHDEPLKEELVLKGELEPTNEGYAIAKIATQKLCSYVARENGLAYKTIIPCNLYGRFDKFDAATSHMIPAVIRRLHEAVQSRAEVVEVWGDGTAKREFMYVGDLADFIAYAIPKFTKMPELLNVGLGFDHSINEYYAAIASAVGYKGRFEHNLNRPIGMRRKLVDTTRLTEFGWKAPTSLEAGIEKTFEYMMSSI